MRAIKRSYVSEREIAAAHRAARSADMREARVRRARYAAQSDEVVLDLRNGMTVRFPRRLIQGLHGALAPQLRRIEISPSGDGVYWPSLDVDVSVPGLMMGVFGTRAWMAAIGRVGGAIRSKAKSRAARLNGRRGGRPRKRPK